MAQEAPVYEIAEGWTDLAIKIIENNLDIFHGVDSKEFVSKMRAVVVTNKERKEGADLFKIKSVTMPIKLFCETSYIVDMFKIDWDSMSPAAKSWMVLAQLRQMINAADPETEGKIEKSHLVTDDKLILSTVGVDYLKRYDLPDLSDPIASKNVQWEKFACDSLDDYARDPSKAKEINNDD